MWVLVYITFASGQLDASAIGSYEKMTQCFFEREKLSTTVGGKDGYFPNGSQAICVYNEK